MMINQDPKKDNPEIIPLPSQPAIVPPKPDINPQREKNDPPRTIPEVPVTPQRPEFPPDQERR